MAQGNCCSGKHENRGASDPAMASDPKPEGPVGPPADATLVELASQWPFGPVFFLGQLGAFVRDHCPDPGEGLPVVEIHLADGEVLDLCHVIGIAPAWVALAVNESEVPEGAPRMRTELVPYGRILRVTVRSCRTGSPQIGFIHDHAPQMLAVREPFPATPEDALRAAATPSFVQVAERKRATEAGTLEEESVTLEPHRPAHEVDRDRPLQNG